MFGSRDRAFGIGVFLGAICGIAVAATVGTHIWQQDLINRGLMQHNAKTGEVEWVDGKEQE